MDVITNRKKRHNITITKKRKLADIVRLDFNKYVVRTTNPVTISEHVYYESVLNMYVIYKMTVK